MGRTKQSSTSWYSRSRSRSVSCPATPRPEPPVGCMSMVHYLIFAPGAGCVGRPPTAVVAPHNNSSSSSCQHRRDPGEKTVSQAGGLEAPRNSLDLDAGSLNNDIQVEIGVQIEPVFDALARTNKATAPTSEAGTPRTPSLVARLMGIDGLPDSQPPSPAPSKPRAASAANKEKKKRVIPETMNRREPLRSLSCNVPGSETDTPRVSTSARASWDGPRLSLQALKENVLDRAAQYMSLPTSPTSSFSSAKKKKKMMKDGSSRRPRRDERESTAKEIVRQAKEAVASRKSKSNAPQRQLTGKENVSPAGAAPAMEDKLVAVVQAGKPTVAPPSKAEPPPPTHAPRVPLAPRQPPPPPPPQRAKPSRSPPPPPPLDPPRARKPDGCERFATRIKKPSAGCHPPLAPPSAVASLACQRPRASLPAVALEGPEYGYLRTVLERSGFMLSLPRLQRRPFKGHSVAAPVDPIVFHLLELELPADEARLGALRHRWNRKLLFHLTQELLADLLLGVDASCSGSSAIPATVHGAALLAKVWKKVRSFPAADCRVVGDIDALVATDLVAASVRRLGSHPAVAEEVGDVADEVAERVLEGLVGECVAESLSLSCPCGWSSSSRASAGGR